MTRYKRVTTSGHTVEWHPDEPIPDGSGGEIHAAHGRATALVNVVSGVSKGDVMHDQIVTEVDMATAISVQEEYIRLTNTPGDINTGIVTP